jgi:hypothetical protein
MAGIFVSYRREDTFAYAGRLYDHLANRFGKKNVFMDVDNIELGLDFVEVLRQTVSNCDAMVVVIGRDWLTAKDEEGRPRLENPEDFVRVEVATALHRNVRVVPALVSGARMPRTQELPADLAGLSRRNALEIADTSFHQSVDRLIEALEKTVQPQPQSRYEPPRPAPPASAAKPAPASIPRWRTNLLLYRPGGLLGWLFRVLFFSFAWVTITLFSALSQPGGVQNGGNWGALLFLTGGTWLWWRAARWVDARAAVKRDT